MSRPDPAPAMPASDAPVPDDLSFRPARVRPWRVARRLLRGRAPGQVVIQYTTRCNAACAQCGMAVQHGGARHTLDPDGLRREIDAMARAGVAAVSFTGGEPLLCLDEIAPLMRHAAAAGIPFIRTGTNGAVFRHWDRPDFPARVARLAAALADTPLQTFWISLDSADPACHEANRGLPGVVEGVRRALPILHEHGVFPAANLGINRLTGGPGLVPPGSAPFDPAALAEAFRRAFRRFYRFVLDLGFVTANACYPMSGEPEAEDAVYAATSGADMIRFRPEEKAVLFRTLSEVIPEFRHRLRIFTPRSALHALARQAEGRDAGRWPCRGGIDFFFLGAEDMQAYPCGYRGGEGLGPFRGLDLDGPAPAAHCERCEWECFRDPSVLLGPVLAARGNPLRLARALLRDRTFARLWWEDLRYYRACQWFNARQRPDFRRLAAFGRDAAAPAGQAGGGPSTAAT
ncbi:MAG: radical SAM protein [Desulfovibrionaceae bacterium]